ncbi:MAG: serine hydrolase domain-containing protein [Planctomycetota bacterium]
MLGSTAGVVSGVLLCVTSLLLLGGCGLVGSGGAPPADEAMIFPGDDWVVATPESLGVDAARLERAMAIIAEIAADHPRHGTAHAGNTQVVVVRRGRVIWHGSDIDTLHRIYSCTKSLNSAVLGLLYDDGICTPDTKAATLLPALAEHYPTMTLGHMASLTSGYNIPWRESPFESRPPLHAPGEALHYNATTNLLNLLMTQAAGTDLKALFRDRIARPIGIPDDAWDWAAAHEVDGLTVYNGAGGMSMTARQLARFGHLFLNEGTWDGREILSREWVRLSTAVRVDPDVPPYKDDAWYTHLPGRYGLNWWVNGRDSDGNLYWPSLPEGSYAAQGNNNNYCFVIPAWEMVLVREGQGKPIDSTLYDRVFAELSAAFIDGTTAE